MIFFLNYILTSLYVQSTSYLYIRLLNRFVFWVFFFVCLFFFFCSFLSIISFKIIQIRQRFSMLFCFLTLRYVCKTQRSDCHAKVRWSALKSDGCHAKFRCCRNTFVTSRHDDVIGLFKLE